LNELAAKQDAFEEANRLKNQFRALDEDEVEFLDSVLESTRREEDRVKRETAEGLARFRQQADKQARRGSDGAADETLEEESWVAGGRKRKRVKEKEGLKGVKIRRSSTSTEAKSIQASPFPPCSPDNPAPNEIETTKPNIELQAPRESEHPKFESPAISKKQAAPSKGGLVDYGSDEDDDW